jgi:ribosomal protein L14E/L6E/L27E
LADGINGGVERQILSIKRIALTDFVLPITRGAREKQIKKVVAKEGVLAKWEATAWAKKLAVREARANTTDFDRFQIQSAKRQVGFKRNSHSLTQPTNQSIIIARISYTLTLLIDLSLLLLHPPLFDLVCCDCLAKLRHPHHQDRQGSEEGHQGLSCDVVFT